MSTAQPIFPTQGATDLAILLGALHALATLERGREAALTEAITEKTYRATLFGWILQREMAISPNVRC